MSGNFKTPILFIIFHRPETTALVFEKIRKIKPQVLYIASDGPRRDSPTDVELCKRTRSIVENVDWECNVKRLYRKENFGLRKSVPAALDWFFRFNKAGIILEDDCLPNESFFNYCQELLELYNDNDSVMHIGGTNFLNKKYQDVNNYYFTKFPHVWGWATWRRAWRKYDLNLSSFPKDFIQNKLNVKFKDYWEKSYWFILFKAVKDRRINTWDYQWVYAIWKSGGVSINPGVNLISNLGFGIGAINTKKNSSRFSKMKTYIINKKLLRKKIKINQKFDNLTSNIMFNSNPISVIVRWLYYRTLL